MASVAIFICQISVIKRQKGIQIAAFIGLDAYERTYTHEVC